MNVSRTLQMGCVLRGLGNDVTSSVSLILSVPVRYVMSYVLHYFQWFTYSDRCSIQLQPGDVNSFFVISCKAISISSARPGFHNSSVSVQRLRRRWSK